MTETPREIRENLIMQWYEKKLNRDELLRVLGGIKSIDKESKKKIERQIMENFYENYERAKSDEKGYNDADNLYRNIQKGERNLIAKNNELEVENENAKKKLDLIDDKMLEISEVAMNLGDGSWWKSRKLEKKDAEWDKLESEKSKISDKIKGLRKEKRKIEMSLNTLKEAYGSGKDRGIGGKHHKIGSYEGWNQGEIGDVATLKGYKEKYMEMIKNKEEYMDNFLGEIEKIDLGVSGELKTEIIGKIRDGMKNEIEQLKNGDDTLKEAEKTENWLKNNWGKLTGEINHLKTKMSEINDSLETLKGREKGASMEELSQIRREGSKLRKELFVLKSEYQAKEADINGYLSKYDGTSIDCSKRLEVEAWEERQERQERERKERGETKKILGPFRKLWKENIQLDENTKNKIIEAADRILVRIEVDSDGSRLLKFKLGQKTYKILDPRLENHTDEEYRYNGGTYSITNIFKDYVRLGGMMGDEVDRWENGELKEYVKQKEEEGFHIAGIEEMKNILEELGEEAGIPEESGQIAMLMYLTGMDSWYWLRMRGSTSRYSLNCEDCELTRLNRGECYGSLFMIACE